MKNNALKAISGMIFLAVSPFVVLTIVGLLYVIFQMLGGISFAAGTQAFINSIYSLVPFFKYLTTIPIIVLVIVVIQNKSVR
ncbi:hypothetical protein JK636_02180 [Clostridium sp. YIM B02515]|uniref:Uncharacterized protein n=1 Tax=Clostridium rhizosphaerae TaxID=2803861 RepID=A0ABS1T5E5_9CLOT|nr:hypothetical protein [Clostridium rhizosphaerae]MBL4934561.1 hypothetical protein [Clostridium rhizosphaerae]